MLTPSGLATLKPRTLSTSILPRTQVRTFFGRKLTRLSSYDSHHDSRLDPLYPRLIRHRTLKTRAKQLKTIRRRQLFEWDAEAKPLGPLQHVRAASYWDGTSKPRGDKRDGQSKHDNNTDGFVLSPKEKAWKAKMELMRKRIESDPYTAVFGRPVQPFWEYMIPQKLKEELGISTPKFEASAYKSTSSKYDKKPEKPFNASSQSQATRPTQSYAWASSTSWDPETNMTKRSEWDTLSSQPRSFEYDPISGRMVPLGTSKPAESQQAAVNASDKVTWKPNEAKAVSEKTYLAPETHLGDLEDLTATGLRALMGKSKRQAVDQQDTANKPLQPALQRLQRKAEPEPTDPDDAAAHESTEPVASPVVMPTGWTNQADILQSERVKRTTSPHSSSSMRWLDDIDARKVEFEKKQKAAAAGSSSGEVKKYSEKVRSLQKELERAYKQSSVHADEFTERIKAHKTELASLKEELRLANASSSGSGAMASSQESKAKEMQAEGDFAPNVASFANNDKWYKQPSSPSPAYSREAIRAAQYDPELEKALDAYTKTVDYSQPQGGPLNVVPSSWSTEDRYKQHRDPKLAEALEEYNKTVDYSKPLGGPTEVVPSSYSKEDIHKMQSDPALEAALAPYTKTAKYHLPQGGPFEPVPSSWSNEDIHKQQSDPALEEALAPHTKTAKYHLPQGGPLDTDRASQGKAALKSHMDACAKASAAKDEAAQKPAHKSTLTKAERKKLATLPELTSDEYKAEVAKVYSSEDGPKNAAYLPEPTSAEYLADVAKISPKPARDSKPKTLEAELKRLATLPEPTSDEYLADVASISPNSDRAEKMEKTMASSLGSELQNPMHSISKAAASGIQWQNPPQYKVLAYDSGNDRFTVVTTTSWGTDRDVPISIPQALRQLYKPARWMQQFADLQRQGYQVVDAREDVLVLKKVRGAGQGGEARTTSPDIKSPINQASVNPVDGTSRSSKDIRPVTGDYANPTGFVNLDLMKDLDSNFPKTDRETATASADEGDLDAEYKKFPRIKREEPVFSGSQRVRSKKRAARNEEKQDEDEVTDIPWGIVSVVGLGTTAAGLYFAGCVAEQAEQSRRERQMKKVAGVQTENTKWGLDEGGWKKGK